MARLGACEGERLRGLSCETPVQNSALVSYALGSSTIVLLRGIMRTFVLALCLTLTACQNALTSECPPDGMVFRDDVGLYCAYGVVIGGFRNCPTDLPNRFDFSDGSFVCSDHAIPGRGDIPEEACVALPGCASAGRLNTLAREMAVASCSENGRTERCDLGPGYADRAECVVMQSEWRGRAVERWISSIAAGRAEFVESEVEACLEALRTGPCGGDDFLSPPLPCRSMMRGAVEEGGACIDGADCGGGLICRRVEGVQTCLPPIATGESCVGYFECADGAVCNVTPSTMRRVCASGAGLGESCGGASGCRYGLHCFEGVCRGADELPRVGRSQPCIELTRVDGADFRVCNQGLFCHISFGICIEWAREGEQCLSEDRCASPASVCVDNVCVRPAM